MTWKEKVQDPQYLMDMRRPLFIASRFASLSAQRIRRQSVAWYFQDVVKTAISMVQVPRVLPNITFPPIEGDTIEKVAQSKGVRIPEAIRSKKGRKKALRSLRKKLGI